MYIYLIIINVISFILYGLDKYKAIHNLWRIPELLLISISFIGGGIGSIIGMIFGVIVSIGLPVAAIVYSQLKLKGDGVCIALGVGVFIVFVMILETALNLTVAKNTDFMKCHFWGSLHLLREF